MPRQARTPRRTTDPMLVWVVDPASPVVRREIGAVRDTALGIHGEIPIEVVVTGEGSTSQAAGRAVVALLASGEVHPVRVVEDVVRLHHDEGSLLVDTEDVARLADQRGQDGEAVALLAGSPFVAEAVAEDRETARSLDDPEDHALFYLGSREVVRLPVPGGSAREILAAIRQVHPRG